MKLVIVLAKVIAVYFVFFAISVLISYHLCMWLSIKDTLMQVLIGYACGLAGTIPSTIISLRLSLFD